MKIDDVEKIHKVHFLQDNKKKKKIDHKNKNKKPF